MNHSFRFMDASLNLKGSIHFGFTQILLLPLDEMCYTEFNRYLLIYKGSCSA